MNKRRICLSMIVKNETPVIQRCLASVLPIIDTWVICDTGSTDGTQQIIKDFFAQHGIPGELHNRRWQDFAHNRSEALALARGKADYIFIIDADDELELPDDYRMPPLNVDSYTIEIQHKELRHDRTQLVRAALPWRYEGVLHEFLSCGRNAKGKRIFPENRSQGTLPNVRIRMHDDGARRRQADSERYSRDATILAAALAAETDPFLKSRYSFYLAQSYENSGDPDRACEYYSKRALLGFWRQEIFISLYRLAKLKAQLGHHSVEVIDAFVAAARIDPRRMEALHGAARYCREHERYQEGYDFAKRALNVWPRPPAEALFHEQWIYDYGALDEYCVCASQIDLYEDSLQASRRLLAGGKSIPAEDRQRMEANARFAFQKIAEKGIAHQEGVGAMTTKSIGLCMIVKNEASVIVRCLDSVRPMIDYVLIEDTGSTDGTQEIIRNWLTKNGIAGAVVEEPWQDFAYNRSHALACLRKAEHIDYAFIIDADDTLTLDPGFDVAAFKTTMDADFYDVPINHGAIRHYRPQICSNRKDFYFRGVLHEFLETPPGSHSRVTASGFSIQIHGGGARSQDPQKFRKDAELLERALQNETDAFLRSRYTFYLAQSYRDFGEKQKALDLYLSRAEMGFWQEEIYVALLGAARLKEELEFPEDDVIAAYQQATESQPARTEALHGASRYCRYKGRNQLGAEIARRGIDLPLPPGALFSEGWIYEWGLLDEHAINAYWAGDYHSCIADCLRILERAKIDEATRTRVIANARFAQDKLREVKPSSFLDASKAPFATPPPPKVLIAILAKSKAGHLPLFLECIEALDYPPEYISLHIRTNNNKDATAEILRDWVARVGARYAHVEFDDSDVAERVQDFDDHEWNTTRFSVLGRIRQHSMGQSLALGCDFYFVVDVDNYLRPLTLRNLVDLNLPIVAPLLRCVDTDRPNYSNYHQIVDANGYFLDSVEYHKILERASPGLHEVALVHCTYLIRADTIPRLTYDDASYRYEYVIFSASARKEAISQVLDNREVYGWMTFGSDGEAIRPLLAAELAQQSLKKALANTPHPPSQNAERTIRLKEYPPLASIYNTPSDDYVKGRRHALGQKPYLLETDALGFIRGTNSPTKSTHTLVVLGDSVVECMYLDPDDRFCAKLETLARGEFGVDVAVKNGGYSGATTLHMLNVFINKVIPMKPDLVILMTGIVDVDVAHVPASFWSRDCWIEPIVELSKDNRWRDNNNLPAPSFADRRRLLDLFSAAARAFGIELWFATIPHRRGNGVDPGKTRARLSINEVTRAAARAGALTLCDLEVELAERYDMFQDDFHLNQAGSETVARSLLARCVEFLQPSTTKIAAKAKPVQSIGETNVINLDRSTKRWELFKDRNKNLGPYTRYSAVDGHMVDRSSLETEGIIAPGLDYSPGALGAALSHIRLWQKAVDRNEPVTIFEDDAYSHPAFNEHRRTVAAQLPDDWDVLFWGYIYDPLFIWIDLGFSSAEIQFYDRAPAFTWNDTANGRSIYSPVRLKHAFGLQAYSISPRGAKRFLTALLPLKKQVIPFPGTSIVNQGQGIDGAMNLVYPKTQSYICIPPLVIHRDDGMSDRLKGLDADFRPLLDEPISH